MTARARRPNYGNRKPARPFAAGLSDVHIAWAAGLIDGDGCIALDRTGAANKTPRPSLRVVMTHAGAVARLGRMFNAGHCHPRRPRPGRLRAFEWVVTAKEEVRAVLLALVPHLVVKRREAEIVLRFLDVLDPDEQDRLVDECRRDKCRPRRSAA